MPWKNFVLITWQQASVGGGTALPCGQVAQGKEEVQVRRDHGEQDPVKISFWSISEMMFDDGMGGRDPQLVSASGPAGSRFLTWGCLLVKQKRAWSRVPVGAEGMEGCRSYHIACSCCTFYRAEQIVKRSTSRRVGS
jgi:hypothetical protein